MKDIKEIIATDRKVDDIIADLKAKYHFVMPWEKIEKEYNPKKHPIVTDKRLRKDKVKKDGTVEKVARITYGLQKLATRRMTQMAFSIPVKRIYNTGTDPLKKEQAKAIETIYKLVRINSINMKRMHAYFASCEICTVWFPVKKEAKHKKYGFETQFELKCRTYSPMDERFSRLECADLYPLFDNMGDMIGMSFQYLVLENNKEVHYFETYTKDFKKVWKRVDNNWTEVVQPLITDESIKLSKIPAIYLTRPIPIWEDTSGNVTEIELTLSRESDIIKKNSAPLVKITGELAVAGSVDTSSDAPREVYQLKEGGNVEYVTWQQQIEAMKFMVSTMKQNVEEELQLPNLSLENVKGLGAISGEARKTLLTDAHLKVGEESGDIVEFLEREFNVIKAFVGVMNTAWKDSINELECVHIVTPFIQNDESASIDKYMKATGGKAIMSQKSGIEQVGLVEDVEAELKQIQDEETATNMLNVFQPAQ